MNLIQKLYNEVYEMILFFLDRSTADPRKVEKMRTFVDKIYKRVNQ